MLPVLQTSLASHTDIPGITLNSLGYVQEAAADLPLRAKRWHHASWRPKWVQGHTSVLCNLLICRHGDQKAAPHAGGTLPPFGAQPRSGEATYCLLTSHADAAADAVDSRWGHW